MNLQIDNKESVILKECILCSKINKSKKKLVKCFSCKKDLPKIHYSKSQWNRGSKKWKPIGFCNNCNKPVIKNPIILNWKINKTGNKNYKYLNKIKLKCSVKLGTPFYRNCLNYSNINLCKNHINCLNKLSKIGYKIKGRICNLCCKFYCNNELTEIGSYIGDTCSNTSTKICRFCKNFYCWNHYFFIKNNEIKMCKFCYIKKNKIVRWYKEILYHPNSNFIKKIGKIWEENAQKLNNRI
jgi:hypothetical protein